MRIDIITCLPRLLESPFADSILQRAQDKGLVEVVVHDLRKYSLDKHHRVDDYAFGGGAGMAPMRSHLYELFRTLKTGRIVTFWYGGRSKRELFYLEDFRQIEEQFPNFKFHLVLSEPLPEDNWSAKDSMDAEGDGFVGFVHQAVIDNYLNHHDAPEDIEFYFCGPPLMNAAVLKMVDDFGVPPENVSFDDFGG